MKRILQITIVLAAIFTAVVSAQQPGIPLAEKQTVQQPGDSITGRIVGDDGQPLSRALVSLSSTRSIGLRKVETDETGEFRVEGLKPGAYTISVSAPGYVLPQDRKYHHVGDDVFITMLKGGVITGTVMNSQGEPVTAVRVSAIRVADSEGHPLHSPEMSTAQYTDDRGVYRVYGLLPGSYLVVANGMGSGYRADFIYKNNGPTYFPSSTSDTAEKVAVNSGQEVSGIDIRYRGVRGYTISGNLSGTSDNRTHSVKLTHASSGTPVGLAPVRPGSGNNSFSISGVADGEYELTARRVGFGDDSGATSPVRRIVVKGADVTGIDLRMIPLGAIAGRLVLEPSQKDGRNDSCLGRGWRLPDEYVIQAHSIKRQNGKDRSRPLAVLSEDDSPDGKGDFLIRNLEPGQYRLNALLPSEDWYVRAITQSSERSAMKQDDAARNGIAVKSGERVAGVLVTVAEGAAGLRGRVMASQKGATLPSRLRVHLVPDEPDQADAVVRFAETPVQSDGTFVISNVAPGRYRLIAQSVAESSESEPSPLAWDSENRAALRREAQSHGMVIEMQPCQRIADHELYYVPASLTTGGKTLKRKQ